jgi:hypothetical protein
MILYIRQQIHEGGHSKRSHPRECWDDEPILRCSKHVEARQAGGKRGWSEKGQFGLNVNAGQPKGAREGSYEAINMVHGKKLAIRATAMAKGDVAKTHPRRWQLYRKMKSQICKRSRLGTDMKTKTSHILTCDVNRKSMLCICLDIVQVAP